MKNEVNLSKKDRARDRRYRKKYGISLEIYNQLLAAQDNKCAICGRDVSTMNMSLAVDHFHFHITVDKVKNIALLKLNLKWIAYTSISGQYFSRFAKTQKMAIADLKELALPYSVRGLLCAGKHGPAGTCCNRNLGRIDNLDWLRKVIPYLENPPAQKVLALKPLDVL